MWYTSPASFSAEQFRRVVGTLRMQDLRRGQIIDGIRMDCLGFVILVYTLLGDTRPIPRFSSTKEELLQQTLPFFDEMTEGDILLLRRREIQSNDDARLRRIFSHFALKFDDEHVVHLPNIVRVTTVTDILHKRLLITRENIHHLVYKLEQRIYEYREHRDEESSTNALIR